jgi:hypothetical protein
LLLIARFCRKEFSLDEAGNIKEMVDADYNIGWKPEYEFHIYKYLDMYITERRREDETDTDYALVTYAIGLTDKPRYPSISDFEVPYESPKWIEYKSNFTKEKGVCLDYY